MSVLDDFEFQYSRPSDNNELPEGYFHILSFRVSPPRDGMLDAIAGAKADWARTVGIENTALTPEEMDCALMYVFPECSLNAVDPVVRFGTILVLWDDITDSLNGGKHQEMIDDYSLGIMSRWKLQNSGPCEFEINNLYLDSLIKTCQQFGGGDNTNPYKHALQIFEHILRAQAVPPLHQVTFEEYKKHRQVTIAGKLVEAWVPAIHGLKISQDEQNSVAWIVDIGCLVVGLANDLYSFPKEFEELFINANLDVIHNAMAVLMANMATLKMNQERF